MNNNTNKIKNDYVLYLRNCLLDFPEEWQREFEKVFYAVESNKDSYDEIIEVTRRSVVLNELLRVAYKKKSSSIFISDSLVSSLKNHKNVLIYDDVIIHGRVIKNLKFKLDNNNVNNVDVAAYCMYGGAEFMADDERTIGCRYSSKSEWRELSDKIVRFIIKSRLPYVTFTQSFAYYSSIQLPDSLNRITYPESTMFSENNITVNVYFPTGWKEKFPLLRALCSYICVREYLCSDKVNPTHEAVVYIPFVIISHLGSNDIDNFKALDIPGCSEVLSSDNSLEYKAMVLSYTLSLLYWKTLGVNSKSYKPLQENIDNVIFKTFPKKMINSLMALGKDEAVSILTSDFTGDYINDNGIDDNFYCFNETPDFPKKEIESFEDVFDDTCKIISDLHRKNEELALSGENKRKVMQFDNFIKLLKEAGNRENQVEKYIASLICLWDLGKASFSFTNIEGGVLGTINDGEQAYAILPAKYRSYIHIIGFLLDFLPISEDSEKYWRDYIDAIQNSSSVSDEIKNNIEDALSYLKNNDFYLLNINETKALPDETLFSATKSYITSKQNGRQKYD